VGGGPDLGARRSLQPWEIHQKAQTCGAEICLVLLPILLALDHHSFLPGQRPHSLALTILIKPRLLQIQQLPLPQLDGLHFGLVFGMLQTLVAKMHPWNQDLPIIVCSFVLFYH
jgi:hypothetical protein